ncbi:MAG TPA: DEAD/DEAH box helicase family protein [Smithellaceae bacterium]|nr:DEAD/DEAH box helicase family protein [Smithellaceae bacterium]
MSLNRLRLNNDQKVYAGQAYRQIKDNGVALIQLPTGQGKTIIALRVIAEILSHSKKPRPIVLVTRKKENERLLYKAFRGEALSKEEYENHPWIRDAFLAKGLDHLRKRSTRKIGDIECRSMMNQGNSFPAGAVVVIDEVHRFQSFLQRTAAKAYTEKPGRHSSGAKQRKFLLLSATPINPTRISVREERGELIPKDEEALEDKRIKTSYLNLYKTMIDLSSLSRKRKDKLLEKLDDGEKKSFEDFALDLRKVMKDLKPIPSPNVLLKLGPKGSTPRCPTIPLRPPAYYSKSVMGLLKFHQAITEQTSLYYCAERMALAGVITKRSANTAGFIRQPKRFSQKGLFHYQPDAPYMENTLVSLRSLERNKKEIRHLLSGKIDALYDFIKKIWIKRSAKPKWKVLIYCAHRGSVAALASELEKKFYKDGITCNCPDTRSDIYGKKGARRVVWDTEGYKKIADRTQSEQEAAVKREFCGEQKKVRCNVKKSRCPRGFVLVTSDRLSESIDLHNKCEIMIHFDLDWSPLRMIQRYGRLWRLEKPKKEPKPPAVFHMIQPGSVDEEIFWRLQKRWESLKKLQLGLELVDLTHALGKRIY